MPANWATLVPEYWWASKESAVILTAATDLLADPQPRNPLNGAESHGMNSRKRKLLDLAKEIHSVVFPSIPWIPWQLVLARKTAGPSLRMTGEVLRL
jgi:hypothetical protein